MNNDLISREALKKELDEQMNFEENCRDSVFDIIDNAPTVEYTFEEAFQKTVCEQRLYCPIRPKGEWIEDSGNIACSHCHTIWLYRRTDFCPNCGADMKGGAE